MPTGHNKTGRSKRRSEPFVMLPWYLLDAPAWLALSPAERTVFIEVMRAFNGHNNGRIALSVRQVAERGRMNKDTATRAFKRLQEIGLLECATKGGFNRKVRHATEWRLLAYPCDVTGRPADKRFMKWGRP